MEERDKKLPEKPRETSGEYLWRRLTPVGCVLVLASMILMLVICFTSGASPIPNYEAPHDREYYSAHPEELAEELESAVFPALGCDASANVQGGRVLVRLPEDSFAVTRSAVLKYFDPSLIEFESVPAEEGGAQ